LRIRIAVAENCDARAFVTRSDSTTMVAAFANAPAYGGGMLIAPNARLDDSKLDVCVVSDINKFKLVCLFPTIYFGWHLGLPQVDSFQAERLRLETEYPLDVYADGEYVCQTPIEVSVAPRALAVIVHGSSPAFERAAQPVVMNPHQRCVAMSVLFSAFLSSFLLFARPSFAQTLPTSPPATVPARSVALANDDSFAIPVDAVLPTSGGLDGAAGD
jgi:hypothetical protein